MNRYEAFVQDMTAGLLKLLKEEMAQLSQGMLGGQQFQAQMQRLLLQFGPLLGSMGTGAQPGAQAYAILGLDPTATDEEVRARYRELAKRLHPDVAGKATEHLFRLVQMAYEQVAKERGLA